MREMVMREMVEMVEMVMRDETVTRANCLELVTDKCVRSVAMMNRKRGCIEETRLNCLK
jgi:hypothetical protein